MHDAIPLISGGSYSRGDSIVIGCFYLASPERILGSFGLKPPASDADTLAWLRPKGIRDFASGLVLLTMMLTADRRLLGIALLVYAIIPFGDMSIVLGSGWSRSTSALNSRRNLRGDACRRPLVDPCHLRGMPVIVLVDRERRRKLVRFLITGENSSRQHRGI